MAEVLGEGLSLLLVGGYWPLFFVIAACIIGGAMARYYTDREIKKEAIRAKYAKKRKRPYPKNNK